jgi:hypothetical protein
MEAPGGIRIYWSKRFQRLKRLMKTLQLKKTFNYDFGEQSN